MGAPCAFGIVEVDDAPEVGASCADGGDRPVGVVECRNRVPVSANHGAVSGLEVADVVCREHRDPVADHRLDRVPGLRQGGIPATVPS